jgi:hypothetical protein
MDSDSEGLAVVVEGFGKEAPKGEEIGRLGDLHECIRAMALIVP